MGNCYCRESRGMTPLMKASRHQNHALVETVLRKNKNNVNSRYNVGSFYGYSAIHFCFWQHTYYPRGSRERCLQLLIEAGADVNLPLRNGQTPLMLAAECSYVGCAKLLLKAKADVNFTNSSRRNAVHVCADSGSFFGRNEVLELLLSFSAKCDDKSEGGKTPLMLATNRGDPKTLQILIDAGSDVNKTDFDGRTPLHYYFSERHKSSIDAVKLLVSRGGNINVIDNMDESLLEKSLHNLDVKMFQFLMYENCQVRDVDLQGFLKPGFSFKPEKDQEKVIGEILIECGYMFKDVEVFFEVFNVQEEVLTLKALSRNAIRRIFGSGHMSEKVQHVELPVSLIDYVLLKDLIPEDIYSPLIME